MVHAVRRCPVCGELFQQKIKTQIYCDDICARMSPKKRVGTHEGKCAICGKSEYEFKRKLAVDHNHRTMIVRGLLCYYDNRFSVGRISSDNAIKVAKYLNPNLTIFIF